MARVSLQTLGLCLGSELDVKSVVRVSWVSNFHSILVGPNYGSPSYGKLVHEQKQVKF